MSPWRETDVEQPLPLDIEVRLLAPLYGEPGSLCLTHGATLVLCVIAIIHIGGFLSIGLLALNVAVLVLRVYLLLRVRPLRQCLIPEQVLRWRIPCQTLGLTSSAIGSLLCLFCLVAGQQEVMRAASTFLILSVSASIASRGAGAQRFALAQIVLWMLPLIVVPLLIRQDSKIVPLFTILYFVVLLSILRRHHGEVFSLIKAELLGRRAIAVLPEREVELRCIFDNAAAGIVEVDLASGRIVRVNRVFCDFVGRSEADLLASTDFDSLTHTDDRAECARQWSTLAATGRPYNAERRYCRPDQTIVWGRVSDALMVVPGEPKPRRLVSIVQDITDHKAAEASVQASQDWLRLSLEIGRVGTFRRDYVSGLIYCSAETRLLVGVPLEGAAVRGDVWFETVLPEDRPRFLKDVAEAHAERRMIVSFDYRFTHPEKGIRYAETRSRVDYDATGRAVTSLGIVIDVTERRRAEIGLAHLAHHDPLTDLPNRSLFRIHLDQVLERARRGEPCAILCLDLDRFKEVNDSFGHAVGDALLCAVTTRLRGACRPTDTVARLGGDEFAIIQAPVRERVDLTAFADRIVAILGAPYEIEGHRLLIGASIGIAIAPEHGTDPDRLLRNADTALYGAKHKGRGCHIIYESTMDKPIHRQRALEVDLRQALADEALELFYQPIVSLSTRRIRGFEALIRWRHPERGLVMPDAFIPLAEANGLIVPLGAFVLQRACAQAALWPDGLSVAANLSASEMGNADLVETVASALRRSGLDPARLTLEITETTMLQDSAATMQTLTKLKTLGVGISIDDFGTGFSSLSYLQRFPFDKVKIDRSFIAPLGQTRESLAIVGAVVKLCEGLDMETTAEGVETEDQLAILSEIGCGEAQGYYFSRPCPAKDVEGMIGRVGAAMRRRSTEGAAA